MQNDITYLLSFVIFSRKQILLGTWDSLIAVGLYTKGFYILTLFSRQQTKVKFLHFSFSGQDREQRKLQSYTMIGLHLLSSVDSKERFSMVLVVFVCLYDLSKYILRLKNCYHHQIVCRKLHILQFQKHCFFFFLISQADSS